MTDYIDDSDFGTKYEEIFNDWYEIEGVRKIKELSRQLRTFFNYKTEIIRYRYRPTPNFTENYANPKFLSQKQEIESLTHDFITGLKKLKTNTQTLEQGIRSLFFDNDKTRINKLSEITKKLTILLHYFSEECIYDHPRFLKFIVVLAKSISMVKKCLSAQFREFYGELEINYHNLESELEILLGETLSVKIQKPKKKLEERLAS